MQMREKVGKSRNTVFSNDLWLRRVEKYRLAEAAGAEPAGQMRDEKYTPLWREAHFQVKMHKDLSFGPLLEVAMSKNARHCGAKHMCK